MKLLDAFHRLLACAHPLNLRLPDEDFPFFRGSCFTVRHERKLFVLTALHCLTNVDVKKTRIDCGGQENDYFPLKRWSFFEPAGSADSDLVDIAIFEVDVDSMTDAEISRAPRLELADNFVGVSELPPRCDLLLEGYPYELSDYSPELQVTKRQSCKIFAVYEGPTERPGISKLSFSDFGGLSDLNGLSGSPVLAVRRVSDSEAKYCLAGMIIRATIVGKCGYFIQSEVLMKALKKSQP